MPIQGLPIKPPLEPPWLRQTTASVNGQQRGSDGVRPVRRSSGGRSAEAARPSADQTFGVSSISAVAAGARAARARAVAPGCASSTMPFGQSTTCCQRETRTPELLFWSQTRCRLAMPPRRAGDGPSSFRLASASSNIPPGLGSQQAARVLPLRAPLLLPSPMLPRLSRPSGWDSNRRQAIMTPVGFEPTRGNPIGSAGRRRGRPSAVSSAHYVAIGNYRRARRDARCDFPADTQI
jgi:hypothetical protein